MLLSCMLVTPWGHFIMEIEEASINYEWLLVGRQAIFSGTGHDIFPRTVATHCRGCCCAAGNMGDTGARESGRRRYAAICGSAAAATLFRYGSGLSATPGERSEPAGRRQANDRLSGGAGVARGCGAG